MLTVVILLQNLRWMLPTTFMMGAAPGYLSTWAVWRLLSLALPKWIYNKGDDLMHSSCQRHVLFCFEKLTGTKIKIYGDLDVTKKMKDGENAIYISNHQCTVDWVVACGVALRRGSLGRLRFVLKDGLKFLPFYGFYLGMHGGLFVKRGGKFDDAKARKQLAQNSKDKTPMWLVIFPEGTRINPDLPNVLAESQRFSRDQGLEALDYVLHPRLRAVKIAVQELQGCVDYIYDVTVAYSNTFDYVHKKRKPAATMQDFLMGTVDQVHIHIARIPISEVPYSDAELRSWLFHRYEEKEKLLKYFYSFESDDLAKFPGESIDSSEPLSSLLPSFLFWSGLFSLQMCSKENREFYGKSSIFLLFASLMWMGIRH